MSRLDGPIEPYLNDLFGHDEAAGKWYWRDWSAEVLPAFGRMHQEDWVVVEVLSRAFGDFDRHLARFTPWQLATGVYYAFNNSMSNFAYAVRDPRSPIERRVAMVANLSTIFDRVFEPHCVPVLAHLHKTTEINSICFMFWDETPVIQRDIPGIPEAAYSVLEHCLHSTNIAVVESALHGLGHEARADPTAVAIIDGYIARATEAPPELLAYAHAARIGGIQ